MGVDGTKPDLILSSLKRGDGYRGVLTLLFVYVWNFP